MDESRRPDAAGMVIAAVLMLIALVVFWDTNSLQLATTYGIGPKAMPYVIAFGLAALAVGNFWLAWQGDFPDRESLDPTADRADPRGLGRADRHHRAWRRLHPGNRHTVCGDSDRVRPPRHCY